MVSEPSHLQCANRAGKAQGIGKNLTELSEWVELDQFRSPWIRRGQVVQSIVDGEQFPCASAERNVEIRHSLPCELAAVFHLLEGPGETIDRYGFLAFAYTEFTLGKSLEGCVTLGFSFDATGERREGIYRSTRYPGGSASGSDWYCESLTGWLRMVIVARGRLWCDATER